MGLYGIFADGLLGYQEFDHRLGLSIPELGV